MPTSAGRRIRKAREAQGMSLRELARRVDLSPSTISLLERMAHGCSNVGDESLVRIAQAIGLDSDAVLAAAGRIAPDVRQILLDGGPALWRFLRESRHAA